MKCVNDTLTHSEMRKCVISYDIRELQLPSPFVLPGLISPIVTWIPGMKALLDEYALGVAIMLPDNWLSSAVAGIVTAVQAAAPPACPSKFCATEEDRDAFLAASVGPRTARQNL